MVLKKEDIVPGARLRVKDVIKYGAGVADGSEEKCFLGVYTGVLGWEGIEVPSGTELEIVKRPRRIDGRWNCVRVRLDDGQEGEVYWTELRSSTEIIG